MTLRLERLALIIGAAVLFVHLAVHHRNRLRDERARDACGGWKKAIAEINGHPPRIVPSGDGADLLRAFTRPEMEGLWAARAWLADNPAQAPALVPFLADPTFVDLVESADVYVIGREMPYYDHGYITADDLFTRAGRASWLLHEATGRSDEPGVPPGTNRIILADRIKSWKAWFDSVNNGETCFSR